MYVFEFDDYKNFVRKKLLGSNKKGHGQYSRIAKHLNIHTSLVSQIFNGPKHLTFEQACGICSFFGFTELETDYFIALVQFDRAGNQDAKVKCKRDLEHLKAQSESLKNRLTKDVLISETDNILLYSHWYYTATKLLCSIKGFDSPEALAQKLNIPLKHINKALEFLISVGLCVEVNGKLKPGPANTHLGSDSPLVARHHQNWRVKGFEKMGDLGPSEIFFTMPATLTEKDSLLLRKKIVDFIDDFVKVIDTSKGEVLYCLNVDWFNVCSQNS